MVALLCLFRPAHAQFTRFENFTDEQGLGNASVSALAQDADGFVLIGTEAGLYRYDGSAIAPFDQQVGLPAASWIRALVSDGRGGTWIATTDALYLRTGGVARRIDVGTPLHLASPHLLAVSDRDVVVDAAGRLFRATLRGDRPGPFAPLPMPAAITPGDLRFVAGDGRGGWFLGCGTSVCDLPRDTDASHPLETFGASDGVPADAWQVAVRLRDGSVWARSLDRIAWRLPGQARFSSMIVPGQRGLFNMTFPARLDLLADGHGGVLTQDEAGLLDFDGRAWRRFAPHEGGLPGNPIQSLMFDREGSLWAGSIGHGVFRSLGWGQWESVTTSDGLPNDIVWAMDRDAAGRLWVATYGGAVRLGDAGRVVPGGSESLSPTRGGRIWLTPPRAPPIRIGTADGAAERPSATRRLTSVFVDAGNRLWGSAADGLMLLGDADAPADRLRAEVAWPQSPDLVTADPSGAVWAATAAGLIRRGASGRFEVVVPSAMLPAEPDAIAFAPGGEIWLAFDGRGIETIRLEHGGVRRLARIAAPVIGSNDIMFLASDRRGRMWVGTDHGIDLFDGRTWRAFDAGDGLISNDLDQNAIFEDADSSMWFGTSRGLVHLRDPSALLPVDKLHPLITGITIGDRSIAPGAAVRARWTDALAIRFVDLDFARRRDLSFRYRMRGLEGGWSETGGHEIRYARLPAGDLAFELVAVDDVHHTTSDPIGFSLHIEGPWWQHWWFYIAAPIGLGAVIYAIWQLRVRLLMRQRHKLERLVQERTAEIEQARNELQWLAMSDPLTGLPNRRAIMRSLDEAIAHAGETSEPLAVLLCDIDHFKKINDTFGHLAGDAVLSGFGHRLREAIEIPEAAGRYGGEEFCIVIPASKQVVLERVAALRSAVAGTPYRVANTDRVITSSGGLAFLRPGETAFSLLARADAALFRAKERGRDRIENELVEDAAHATARAMAGSGPDEPAPTASASTAGTPRRTSLEADLREALASDQFCLFYQPVADVERRTVTSCEALIRWNSPTRGWVSPVNFIPFAEEVGLMPAIGDWVLRRACRDAATWHPSLKVSVNLSPMQFRLPDLVSRIEAVLAETAIAPGRLELEVTETAMIEEMEAVIRVLAQMRSLGITVALDDFGTGYSSLSFLRLLPFDRIKIDRSFVQDLGRTRQAGVIVRAISEIARELDATVTAEGAETDAQIAALRALRISEIQGYAIGRPGPASELRDQIARIHASLARGVECVPAA